MRRELAKEAAKHHPATIVFVGSYPPPVHGAAVINAVVIRIFQEAGLDLKLVSRNRRDANCSRLQIIVHGAVATARGLLRALKVMASGSKVVLYISLSGGLGQAYELLFVALARASRRRIVVHHQSFAYVTRPSRLTRMLFAVAGRGAIHIVACRQASDLLRYRYDGLVMRTVIVRNSSLPPLMSRVLRGRSVLQTVGFLSNITREKGIEVFLEVVRKLYSRGRSIRAVVAGPCEDDEIKRALEEARDEGLIEYWGAVYAKDKAAFFETVDVLLFPSRYAHETNPVVVVEALASGSPVISSDRGCLTDLTEAEGVIVVRRFDQYVDIATSRIIEWLDNPNGFRAMNQACANVPLSDSLKRLLGSVGMSRRTPASPLVQSA
jgi:glycosyltransferase involved in cell wall biosynthesis